MKREFAKDLRGASERDQGIEQSHGVAHQRNAEPD